jgi:hypothetical protein
LKLILFYYVDCSHGYTFCFALTKYRISNAGIGVDTRAGTYTALQFHGHVKIGSKMGSFSPVFKVENKNE